ncbi:hypothetical protein ACFQ0M_03005 [Kitasatospora aburaviensis]
MGTVSPLIVTGRDRISAAREAAGTAEVTGSVTVMGFLAGAGGVRRGGNGCPCQPPRRHPHFTGRANPAVIRATAQGAVIALR